MTKFFYLTKIGEDSTSSLNSVDEALCNHFGEPVSSDYWYQDWYNTLGLALAVGRSWENMKKVYPKKIDAIEFLQENYTVTAGDF